jgi:hypothetical protein
MATNTALREEMNQDAIREDGDRPAGAELISFNPTEQHRSVMLLKLPNQSLCLIWTELVNRLL